MWDVYSIKADHYLPARSASASVTHSACRRVILPKLRAADKHTGETGKGVSECAVVGERGAAEVAETMGKEWGAQADKSKRTCVTSQFTLESNFVNVTWP